MTFTVVAWFGARSGLRSVESRADDRELGGATGVGEKPIITRKLFGSLWRRKRRMTSSASSVIILDVSRQPSSRRPDPVHNVDLQIIRLRDGPYDGLPPREAVLLKPASRAVRDSSGT